MPGPGGGSRGGGGFGGGGGGFRGGGHGGFGGHHGGFGGPRGPRGFHYHRGPFFWGPRVRFYGPGGGCLGILLAPVIIILMAGVMLMSVIGGAVGSISEGGMTDYQESEFQAYADSEYQKAFGRSSSYEDNILLVVLTNKEADEYYYIAWVGDHIHSDITNMFGAERTEFGQAMNYCVNQSYYAYSLDSDLANVVDKMAGHIERLSLDSSFKRSCGDAHTSANYSRLTNYTDLSLTADTVDSALKAFTEQTGIAIAIVVDDMDEVLGVDYTDMIISIIIILVLVAIAVFLIIKGVRAYNEEKKRSSSNDQKKDNEWDNNYNKDDERYF